jgi:hypothetical protein
MAVQGEPARMATLGVVSVIFGLLGLLFVWLVPIGGIISLTGVVLGVLGRLGTIRGNPLRRWALGGAILSLVALALQIIMTRGGVGFFLAPWSP